MMGTKALVVAPLPPVCLEDLGPPDHIYRHLAQVLDLGFVRDLVRDAYADTGRPAIDPVIFFKLQLTLFFEGLRAVLSHAATTSGGADCASATHSLDGKGLGPPHRIDAGRREPVGDACLGELEDVGDGVGDLLPLLAEPRVDELEEQRLQLGGEAEARRAPRG